MPITTKSSGNLTSPYAARLIGEVVRQTFEPLGDDLVAAIQADSPESFRKSIKKAISGQGLLTTMRVYSSDPAYEFIEKGRKPGKQPPPNVLLAWVKRKGLGANAQSIRTRRSLATGIRRTRSRETGQLRTRVQSLEARQRSIAYAIGRQIAREGLPRHTGFKPSHALGLFEGLKQDHAREIAAAYAKMQDRIAQILNG